MNEISRTIESITVEIKVFEKSMKESIARHAWEIGKRLNEVKKMIPHGEFASWLEVNFEFSDRYAQEFMKFNTLNPNLNSVFDSLEWTKIREVMSLPESIDHQEFIEQSHTIPSTGETKTVDEMTVRELREVKKALKEAQERASNAETEKHHFQKLWQQEKSKPPQVVKEREIVEVVPDHIKKQLEDQEFKIKSLRHGYQESQEKLKQFTLQNADEFDIEQARKQREKLQHEADLTTLKMRVAYKNFIENAAVSSYISGALATASPGEKAHLMEMVEMAEKVIHDTKIALRGRKLGVVNE